MNRVNQSKGLKSDRQTPDRQILPDRLTDIIKASLLCTAVLKIQLYLEELGQSSYGWIFIHNLCFSSIKKCFYL